MVVKAKGAKAASRVDVWGAGAVAAVEVVVAVRPAEVRVAVRVAKEVVVSVGRWHLRFVGRLVEGKKSHSCRPRRCALVARWQAE